MMTTIRNFKFAACLAVLAFANAMAAQTPKPVRTQAGMVQGKMEGDVAVYKGIPFAAPPQGDLRWRAPQPPAAWKGVRDADKFAPACMQTPIVMPALGLDALAVSEDCLYLNVWTPAKSPKDHLAVMVWIYGGGFTIGGTSLRQYDGEYLAKKGVVLVSIAYRLGPFGFLATPDLSAEDHGHSGNYGMLDQIAGLEWVKHNIAAFGGNPNRVTIFGESAGGIAVSMLAASPLAKGLFQGAISESGGSFAPARFSNEGGENVPPLAVAEHDGSAFLAKIGAKSIADARKMSAESITKASPPGAGAGFWPNLDGYFLPGDEYNLYEEGRYNDTPVLIGTNSDEGALFVASTTASVYEKSVHTGYGEYADKLLAAYPTGSDVEALRSARDLARDSTFGWGTWTWARLQSKRGKSKVYVYYFSHRPPYPNTPQFKSWGAAHGAEISYVFGNFTPSMPPSAEDRVVSDTVSSYWVNFAKTGNPNAQGMPAWPAFSNAKPEVMNLNDPSKAIPLPNAEKLKALDGYYAWRRSQEAEKLSNNSPKGAN